MEKSKLYCFCRKAEGGRFMICCDACSQWFHGSCVAVRQSQKLPQKWFCPICVDHPTSTSSASNKEVACLKTDLQSLTRDVSVLKDFTKKLDEKIDSNYKDMETLVKTSDKDNEIIALQDQLKFKDGEIIRLQKEATAKSLQDVCLKDLTQNLNGRDKEIRALQDQLKFKDGEIIRLQKEATAKSLQDVCLKDLTQNLNERDKEIISLLDQLKLKNDVINNLQKETAAAAKSLHKVESLQQQIRALERRLGKEKASTSSSQPQSKPVKKKCLTKVRPSSQPVSELSYATDDEDEFQPRSSKKLKT